MSGNYLMVHPVRDLEDPENLDFRPKSGSPLVSSANPQFAPRIDLFGTRRPQGRGPDIGAIEAP